MAPFNICMNFTLFVCIILKTEILEHGTSLESMLEKDVHPSSIVKTARPVFTL